MFKLSFICLAALVAVACAHPAKEEHYTDRYNNMDMDEILNNRRLLIPYLKCVLDQGKCSPEGKELKSHIKEALENNCAKCDEKQREGAKKALTHIINKEPEYWTQLVAKYDPDHKFTRKYEKELKQAQG